MARNTQAWGASGGERLDGYRELSHPASVRPMPERALADLLHEPVKIGFVCKARMQCPADVPR